MEIELNIGKTCQSIRIDDGNLLGVLKPRQVSPEHTGVEEVSYALAHPVDSPRLCDIVKPGERIVIITSDITRPMPSRLVLPELLKELIAGGTEYKDITVVFALGSHRAHTEEEKKYLAGEEVYGKVNCVDSSVKDCVYFGMTSRGTPVEIFRPVAEADRIICLGNIEFHYFAGYSGGAKAIMPGVSTRNAIQANHSMMVMKGSHAGELDNNPVRQDIEEAANLLKIDFILNVVLDEKKNIVKGFAGNYIKAHREGCKFLDSLYKVQIEEKADIVVVSAGGYPKDINLYQAQKALDNAKHAVKEGGIIILAAACREGFGEDVFEEWMTTIKTPEEMIIKIRENFVLGGHKAAAIGMIRKNADLYLVSELPCELVENINMKPFGSISDAIAAAYQSLGNDAKAYIIPFGGSTLPYCV